MLSHKIDYSYIKKAIRDKKLPDVEYGTVGCDGFKYQIPNFKHIGGKNCILSSLNKTLRHYDINYSEEMLLGIASGLSMIVMQFKHGPFVGGLNAKDWNCIRAPLDRLGIEYKLHETGSVLKAHQKLKDILRKGQPAVTFVDMAFLPHFFSDQNMVPNEKMGHFGGHTVVVYGLDEMKGEVLISDRFGEPVKIPLNLFQMARASKFAPFAAKNKILELFNPEKSSLKSLKEIIPMAIKQNIDQMLNPPIKMLGVPGFLKYKQVFPTWWSKYPGDQFIYAILNLFIFMEVGGCGGAMFRDMYRIFLGEAAVIMEMPSLNKAIEFFEVSIEAIHNLGNALLPDELEWMGKLRKSLLEFNATQESMPDNLNILLKQMENDQKNIIERAISENLSDFPSYFPKIVAAIQHVHDAEKEAWEYLAEMF
ncbi:hypothetical protein NEF87_005039 [Candidatus Lokiarchaeum ossiferum]|uniref:DUF4872 domain-containing protein n=1 Tax=Candidatus Lokiarchaeum ossiferum TaxID=2951803 RepID=A0ABY6I1R8_9ARCH|nr:hypothetical protein NEF87_005039 [Candidatus Lokiarchaeum sp. B-35]